MIDLALEEILQKKKENKEQNEHNVDWEKEKKLWIESVNSLYKNIEFWLKDYKNKKLLDFYYSDIDLEETDIGKYKIRQMHIKLPEEEIKLTPLGTMLIGAFGRIDIEYKYKNVRLILVPEESKSIKIKATILKDGNESKIKKKETSKIQEEKWTNLKWKIIMKELNKPLYLTLEEISFIEIFKELISNE